MSEHDDIEGVLSRYRPASPPAALRNRVVAGRPSRPRAWSYMKWFAAAAALVVALVLHMQASRTFDDLARPRLEQAETARATAIDEMTALLGGGDLARRAAERGFDASQSIRAAMVAAPISVETTWIR